MTSPCGVRNMTTAPGTPSSFIVVSTSACIAAGSIVLSFDGAAAGPVVAGTVVAGSVVAGPVVAAAGGSSDPPPHAARNSASARHAPIINRDGAHPWGRSSAGPLK